MNCDQMIYYNKHKFIVAQQFDIFFMHKKRLCRHVHNSTVSICVNYIILITQNIYFLCIKKRLCRHVRITVVSFCINYIILTPQNIYFFNSQNIYYICKKNDYIYIIYFEISRDICCHVYKKIFF